MVLSSENTHVLFINGHKYSVSKKKQAVLQNFFLGKAKKAIWLTQKNREVGLGALVSVDAPYLHHCMDLGLELHLSHAYTDSRLTSDST